MSRKTNLPDSDKLNKIRRDCLLLFEQSLGWKFRVKGTPLVDEVTGVDHTLQMVCGKQYGNFHIDLCQLTNEDAPLAN
jgi:hypothetical protein